MSDLKTAGVVVVGFAAVVGLLFATGVIEAQGDDPETEPAADEAPRTAPAAKRGMNKARGRRRGKGKKRGRRRNHGRAPKMRPEDREKLGVTIHDEARASDALMLYNPCGWGKEYRRASNGEIVREARLLNAQGDVLRTWSSDFADDTQRGWALARLSETGDLYAVNAREGFVKLNWDNELQWAIRGGFHHDFAFAPDGKIWVLNEKRRDIVVGELEAVLLDNSFSVVTLGGDVREQFSIYDALKDEPFFKERLAARVARGGSGETRKADGEAGGRELRAIDAVQANTVDFMTGEAAGLWAKGDIVTSLREMNTVVVFSKEGKLKWHWGPGELRKQYDPSPVGAHNLLVFDSGPGRGFSRVLEIDPTRDNEIVWTYRGTTENPFFSGLRGLAQRLENENVFIASSQQGRAFEVTQEGEIVWEYWSPDILHNDLRLPFRMVKLQGKTLENIQARLAAENPAPTAAGAGPAKAAAPGEAATAEPE